MKDTYLPYLGRIPDSWKLALLGRFAIEVQEPNTDCSETNALQFKMGRIISKSEGDSKYHPDTLEGYNVVLPGDIIINGLNLNYDLKSLRVGQVQERGVITGAYIAIRPKGIDSDYLKYLLKGFDFIKTFHGMGKGIRITLSYGELKKMFIPIPSMEEQKRIGSFLDNKCAEIDSILENTRTSIDDYRALKQSVITEAVTKGVGGVRKMKRAGIEWIEDIPIEWSILPLKNCFYFGKGLSITKDDLVEVGRPVISYGQIHSKTNTGVSINANLIRFVKDSDTNDSSMVFPNDFAFSDTSEDLEGCGNCVYNDTDKPFYGGYHTIVLHSKTQCPNKYLAYLFKTDVWRHQIRSCLTEVKVYSVSQKVLRRTTIIVPPVSEQQEITAYLDEKCATIDSLIASKEALIAELEAYKKSIIYEYVTGKKEVI